MLIAPVRVDRCQMQEGCLLQVCVCVFSDSDMAYVKLAGSS